MLKTILIFVLLVFSFTFSFAQSGESDKKIIFKANTQFSAQIENELDTEKVEPLIYMTDETNVLRPDTPELTVTQKEALKNAPRKDSDYFKAPKVIEQNR